VIDELLSPLFDGLVANADGRGLNLRRRLGIDLVLVAVLGGLLAGLVVIWRWPADAEGRSQQRTPEALDRDQRVGERDRGREHQALGVAVCGTVMCFWIAMQILEFVFGFGG
jgi:hypothetical protein